MNTSLRTIQVLLVGALAASATACASSAPTAAPAADCKPAAEFKTIVDGTLTVAAIQQLPGINVDVNTKKITGLDSVLLTKFAEENCLRLDVQPLAGAAAVAAMTEGKADVAGGGWYKTAERAKVLGQSETLWYDQAGIVSNAGLASIDELAGKKVGVVGGSLFEKPLGEAIGAENVVSYQSIDAIFKDLESGRIDAALGAGATLAIQIKDRGNSELKISTLDPNPKYEVLTKPGEPNYPYTKSNEQLGAALNDFIKRAKEEGLIKDALAEYGITSQTALEGPSK
jgi:polar amino acid transport system substrate-binding protein